MVKAKLLDKRGAYREDFQSISLYKEIHDNDKLHLGLLTIVSESGFNNIFCVFLINPYGA